MRKSLADRKKVTGGDDRMGRKEGPGSLNLTPYFLTGRDIFLRNQLWAPSATLMAWALTLLGRPSAWRYWSF